MIVFVIGPACAGKSTYIKNNFPDFVKIDLKDYQNFNGEVKTVWDSYIKCQEALRAAVMENKDVVMEHTMLLRKRRPMYLETVREVSDEPIDVHCILPCVETLFERRNKRNVINSLGICEEELDVFEIPLKDDGFRDIYIIRD